MSSRKLESEALSPWTDPVDGAQLLDEFAAISSRLLFVNEHERTVLTLWPAFAHTHDAHEISPILAFTSPMPGCGKTQCGRIMALVTPRPHFTSNASKASLFRIIERQAGTGTLLLDECETYAFGDNAMRGILNSGHTKAGASVSRAVGDNKGDYEGKAFSVWAPKVMMYIGQAPPTIAQRSLTISMRRALANETPEQLTDELRLDLTTINRKLSRWGTDNFEAVRTAKPKIPLGLRNRTLDNWRPLFAIAEVVGGVWPERVYASAIAMTLMRDVSEPEALLEDIRRAFITIDTDRINTFDLLDALNADDEAPWGQMRYGAGMNAMHLSAQLLQFGIHSEKHWQADGRSLRGYKRIAFADAFSRYLSPHEEHPEGRNAVEGDAMHDGT